MIKTVENSVEYDRLTKMLRKRINTKTFANNPFCQKYCRFLGFEFSYIFNSNFFVGVKEFLKKTGESRLIFYLTDPPADKYYYQNFGKYGVFIIDKEVDKIAWSEMIDSDPGDSPADCIWVRGDEFVLFSESNDWTIICSREWDISIVGLADEALKKKFLDSFNEDSQTMFTTIQTQAEAIIEMLDLGEDGKSEYYNLINNYRDCN